MTKEKEIEEKIEKLVNNFIQKWIPQSYPHLVDTDENDGERLRDNLKDLIKQGQNSQKDKDLEDLAMIIILEKARIRRGYVEKASKIIPHIETSLNKVEEELTKKIKGKK